MSEISVPLWLVLGKTRVGKGEFIKTTIQEISGKVLDITSDRLESHTKKSARYPFILEGKAVALMDTVGYDDSSGDDVSSEAFLKMIEETGKEVFYPPLVILRELSGSDKEWLKRIRSVFSSIVCAIRCKAKTFSTVAGYWAASELANVPLFHLHEFLDAEDDGGVSHEKYLKDVQEILAYYGGLIPGRENLEFDSDLFKGTYERIEVKRETKTEDRVDTKIENKLQDEIIKREKLVEVKEGGHYEEQEVQRDGFERAIAAVRSLLMLGVDGWRETRTVNVWVPDTKQIAMDNSYVESMTINFLRTTTTRQHYERTMYEVWKVLTSGIRIFKATECSEWRLIREEIVDDNIELIPKQSGQLPAA